VKNNNNKKKFRGETKEDGTRVGLRQIDRVVSGASHPKLQVAKFIICILHLACRGTEKLLFLVLVHLQQLQGKGKISESQKLQRLGKFNFLSFHCIQSMLRLNGLFRTLGTLNNRLNGLLKGRSKFQLKIGKEPEKVKLNGTKAKAVLEHCLQADDSFLDGLLSQEEINIPEPARTILEKMTQSGFFLSFKQPG